MFYSTYKCAKLLYCLYKLFYDESDKNIIAIKKAAEECGVVGTKLLQFIMMHDGFLSAEGKKHFGYVFENCECHRWEETCKMYAEDFTRCLAEDFDLDEDSAIVIGSGSIGQVYKLWDKKEGKHVAVKVRHPGVDKHTVQFIKSISWLISVVEYMKTIPFSFLLREFLNNIHCQLDYAQEAKNTNQLHDLFKGEDASVIVPKVVRFSPNFIIMDYYEGRTYHELAAEEQRCISCNIYLFMLSSLLCYDFLHCDLHYGNWKISDDNRLIIYDCGIIARTGNKDINRDIVMMFIDGDFRSMGDVLLQDNTPHSGKIKKKVADYMRNDYAKSSDRLADIIKMMVLENAHIDVNIFRCFQGFAMCMNIIKTDTDKLVKLVGKEGNNKDILTCYYHGILSKLNRFKGLLDIFDKIIADTPRISEAFYDWLEDSFGHRDKDVFIDVIMEHMFATPAVLR